MWVGFTNACRHPNPAPQPCNDSINIACRFRASLSLSGPSFRWVIDFPRSRHAQSWYSIRKFYSSASASQAAVVQPWGSGGARFAEINSCLAFRPAMSVTLLTVGIVKTASIRLQIRLSHPFFSMSNRRPAWRGHQWWCKARCRSIRIERQSGSVRKQSKFRCNFCR